MEKSNRQMMNMPGAAAPGKLTGKLLYVWNKTKTSLCGRDGRTLCGPRCVIV